MRDRFSRPAGRLVDGGKSCQQAGVVRPGRDSLRVLDDCSLPMPLGCVQIANASHGGWMTLEYLVERLLVADNSIRGCESGPGISDPHYSEALPCGGEKQVRQFSGQRRILW